MDAAARAFFNSSEISVRRNSNVAIQDFVRQRYAKLFSPVFQWFPAKFLEHCGWTLAPSIFVEDKSSSFPLNRFKLFDLAFLVGGPGRAAILKIWTDHCLVRSGLDGHRVYLEVPS